MSGKTNKHLPSSSRRLPSRIGFVFLLAFVFIIQRFFLKDPTLRELSAIYPFFYLALLVCDIVRGRGVRPLEVWFAVNATWILIITHAIYIPPAILLFAIIVWSVHHTIWAVWSVVLLSLMWFASFLSRA